MTKPITVQMLREKGACEGQVKKFQKLFGDSVIPTEELCVKHVMDFDLNWIVKNLLPLSQKAYLNAEAPLLKAYSDAKAPLWKAYNDAEAPLLKAYEDAEALLRKDYKDARALLWKAYIDAEALLRKAYFEACARLFFKLWNEQ